MKKATILIAYTNTGSGHRTPAIAIAERIEELHPNKFNIITSNFFEEAGAIKFNQHIESSWNILLKLPLVTKILQIFTRLFYFIAPYHIQLLHPIVYKKSLNYIKSVNPDLVFSTHFFCHSMAIEAKKRFNLHFPITALNPDTFDTFPQWDSRGDLLLVCSELAKEQAIKLNHLSEKTKIVPQPLRKEFTEIKYVSPQELRPQYNLRDVFTILMSDGGQGVGKTGTSIKHILKKQMTLNLIIICGKNEKRYKKLSALQQELQQSQHPTQLLVYSFVDSMTPFIQMSDLFIGKSGPATIMECLKLKLPVLVNFSANNAERNTAKYFIQKGTALSCAIPMVLPKKIETLMEDPSILQNLKDNIDKLDLFHDGSTIIAEILVNYLDKHISINSENHETVLSS